MKERILLITKDAMCKEYLPAYGNLIWKDKTPNIDELVRKGTLFMHHCTAAPSTVMSFRAMMTGKFAYEQPYKNYTPKEIPEAETDFFSIAKGLGYKGHIIWDSTWDNMVLRYGNCYGHDTVIHSLRNIKQGVGCHYNHVEPLVVDDKKSEAALKTIMDCVKEIIEKDEKVVLWIHLPHVINGRTAYGGDIDLLDRLVGELRQYFDDDTIYISSDHGNMNGVKNKYCYGFDVNTPAVEIPLISPRVEGESIFEKYTSNVDLKELIFNNKIVRRKYLFSDCAYYGQPHRKLAIYSEGMAYIYDKSKKSEELYDVLNDYYESCNLLEDNVYDVDRKVASPVREYYYSPKWDDIDNVVETFRQVRKEIWRQEKWYVELKEKVTRRMKNYVHTVLRLFRK